MNKLKNYYGRQPCRQKINPANRRHNDYKCLNCGAFLRHEPRLINNEEVLRCCFCGYLNIFSWDSVLNIIQRMTGVTIDYSEFGKLPKLE
jgi:DNA-directed RNA polymerase subunit RPC12/RpoP